MNELNPILTLTDDNGFASTSRYAMVSHVESQSEDMNRLSASPEMPLSEPNRLVEWVYQDICDFLTSNTELLFNERDLQMHLALWLRQSAHDYDDVDLEYFVPREVLGRCSDGSVGESDLRLDIVVRRAGEFLPVELKYKTRRIARKIERFGEMLQEHVEVVKNQGAQDLGMYHFWKDIRRIELICQRFYASVKNGLAVFVTNDPKYLKESSQSNHAAFSMSEGAHETRKYWNDSQSVCAARNPGFEVEQPYIIHWQQHFVADNVFYFCVVKIGDSATPSNDCATVDIPTNIPIFDSEQ